MTYETAETSVEGGRPYRLYDFGLGTIHYRYTSALEPDDYGSVVWESQPISDDGLRITGETSADEMIISCPASLEPVKWFRGAPPATPVAIIVRERHHGQANARIYFIGEVWGMRQIDGAKAELRCNSDLASLQRTGLRLAWTKNCTHTIYDSSCKVSPALFAFEAFVLGKTDIAIQGGAWDIGDGYFDGGYVEWSIGGGEFDQRGIENHVGDTLTLVGGTGGINVGMTLVAHPGCDLAHTTCHNKFGNILNHGGKMRQPGKSPFDGNPVF